MAQKVAFLFCFILQILTLANCVNYQPRAIQLAEDTWQDILEGEWMVEL